MFYVGSYPIYEFTSSNELADAVLQDIQKLEYPPKSSGPTFGYVGTDRQQYHNQQLYDWLYDCLNVVSDKHLKNINLKIVDLWSVKTKFGEAAVLHNHTNSMFSGVYHLTDCDRSELVFQSPDNFYEQWKFLLADNLQNVPNRVSVKPKKGKLYIWPSSLLHSINPHTQTMPRYSLAFNTFFEINESYETKRLNLNCSDKT